jgi:hypothetical protein
MDTRELIEFLSRDQQLLPVRGRLEARTGKKVRSIKQRLSRGSPHQAQRVAVKPRAIKEGGVKAVEKGRWQTVSVWIKSRSKLGQPYIRNDSEVWSLSGGHPMPNLVVSRVPTLETDYNSMAWVCTLESLRKFSVIFLLPN